MNSLCFKVINSIFGGAYRKKWWDVTSIGAGIKTVLDARYRNYQPLTVNRFPQDDDQSMEALRIQREEKDVEQNWQRLEQALKQEMQNNLHFNNRPHSELPDYHLLAPIAINRVLDEQAVDQYIARLKAYYNGKHKESPRPALGYEGFFEVKDEDDFIRRMLASEDFIEVDQQDVLFDHSGMRIPSEALFEKIYVETIWKRFLSNSGFGLYSR